MTIDWSAFTPWSSLAGGVLIGLAASALLLMNGRIAGISGVIGGILRPARGDAAWRVAFVAGLFSSPWLLGLVRNLPTSEIGADYSALMIAGLLVGLGTRYGAGCTSGHGVCGLARGSPRSLLATACFMGAGFATVYFLRHVVNL